jgi:hypothetical protein
MSFLTGNTNPDLQSANISNPLNPNLQGQVQSGISQQERLIGALNDQNGIQNQSQVFNNLGQVAAGAGPNPAQALLAEATRRNIAQQGALMAGQRGASGNTGLIARQAAQAGGAIGQDAATQAALLQSQQQLGALNAQAGVAGQQVGNQLGAVQGLNAAVQGNQGQVIGANSAFNNANVANTGQMNDAKAKVAAGNAQAQGGLFGGIVNGIGAALGLAEGGEVPKLSSVPSKDRFKAYPSHLRDMASIYHGDTQNMSVGGALKEGGMVPGKAKVSGDSLKNDTVAAKLSPGEVVIPKSVMESDDPVKGAAAFVAALQKKKGSSGEKGKPESDFKEALAKAIKGRKNK